MFLDMPAERWIALKQAARERVVRNFSVQQLVQRTEASLARLIEDQD
jgi:hypothetical protein